MKPKGIVWLPIVIMITAVAAFTITTVVIYRANQEPTENTGTSQSTACASITDRNVCEQREDCLSLDICNFITAENQAAKCNSVPKQAGACIRGGFSRCVALDCSQDQSTLEVDTSVNSNVNTNLSANTNSSTADWQTYTNSTNGGPEYSFQYPPSWRVSDFDPQYLRVVPPNGDDPNRETASPSMQIDFIVVPGSITLKELTNPSETTVGGKTATEGTIEGVPTLFATQVPVEGGVLQIAWTLVNEYDATHKQILSTFQFTN